MSGGGGGGRLGGGGGSVSVFQEIYWCWQRFLHFLGGMSARQLFHEVLRFS